MGTEEMFIIAILPGLALVISIAVAVYMIRLLKRLVIAAEKIAEKGDK